MESAAVKVLVVDDDEDDFIVLKDRLAEIPDRKFALTWASSFDAGRTEIARGHFDVCFLDFRLGAKTGLDFLRETVPQGFRTPIILLTGYGEHEVDLEAMRIGAADYLVKDQINPTLLERSIRYSIFRRQSLDALKERETQVLMQDRLASVGLLASSIAHEIGTPISVIRGRAEYMALQCRNEPLLQKNADIIISQIDRVSKLIRSLLNLARGDGLQMATEIHLTQVLEEVFELIGHELSKRSIEVRMQLPIEIPVIVRAESQPLHQVFLNLVVNSMHAIDSAVESGRSTGHFIHVDASETPEDWIVSIEDSGCGISKENMQNLFKPFFTTKDIGVGTGLGLVTSYRIVETWGGKIQAESQEGMGTTFKLILPKAKIAQS